MCVLSHFCHVQIFVMLWTAALQAPLSMGFSREEYWVGCHALVQGIFLTQGGKPCLLTCRQILYRGSTGEAHIYMYILIVFTYSKVSVLRILGDKFQQGNRLLHGVGTAFCLKNIELHVFMVPTRLTVLICSICLSSIDPKFALC